jgi:hypothetical protein
MAGAVVVRKVDAVENGATVWSRSKVLTRYRHLREISKQHHSEAMNFLSKDAILQHGRRIGFAHGRTFVLDNMDELTLAFDLAIHTAPAGRSRAIDRYAKSARLAPGSDEALVLEAMRQAQFAIICVERRHQAAGLIVKDVMRGTEHWLVDEGLEISVADGALIAMRFFTPEEFAMTAGVLIPLDRDLIADALDEMPQLYGKSPATAANDRRFAEAIYRVAHMEGVMELVAYQDPGNDAD